MTKFQRASLVASEEVFNTNPAIPLEDATEVVTESLDLRPRSDNQRQFALSRDEIELLVEAIQASKYPSKARPPSLDKHERLDILRAKLQAELR